MPTPATSSKVDRLRVAFSTLGDLIDEVVPPAGGRLKALAHTALELAAMWATKACVFGDPDSKIIEPPSEAALLGSEIRRLGMQGD